MPRPCVDGGMIAGFEEWKLPTPWGSIHAAIGGSGPPLLLLHGFPETHLMWRDVAPLLAAHFSIVAADLPGQGASGPATGEEPYTKRSMARSLIAAMASLGHDRFAVAGHDRGGRVAYRMALDHPAVVAALAVLDVVPIAEAWDRADDRLAQAFWPWSLLSQPEPLPERLIGGAPDAVIADAVRQWGTEASHFPPEVVEAYTAPLRDPARIHAICEEFRAATGPDREHDHADRAAGRRIDCPTLLLWDEDGAVGRWYADAGGPLGVWRPWARRIEGRTMKGGHFFPEAQPADALLAFLAEERSERSPSQQVETA